MNLSTLLNRKRLTPAVTWLCTAAVACVLACVFDVPAHAQDPQPPPDPPQRQTPAAGAGDGWTWSTDANVFVGYNYQARKFADFSAWESQNWFMATGSRPLGRGRVTVDAMLSLESLTIGRFVYGSGVKLRDQPGGSPQLYQTGETFHLEPLINYQHPHDFFMALSAKYRIERPRVAYTFTGAIVGSPALGPPPFMHRESARDNPQVPLGHHSLDATHISTGVLTGGVEVGPLSFEASAFRGAEPDEDRFNIERPRLDSWSARVGWRRGPWQAQVSGGRLKEPEWYEPWDVARVTASIGFNGTLGARPFDTTIAWGHNLEYNGFNNRADAYMLEWDLHATDATAIFGRTEKLKKQLFGLGFHPRGLNHPHIYSDITALTVGAVQDLFIVDRWGRLGIGADITVYRTSADLTELYGSSRSYHVFLRWRPNRSSAAHVH